MSTRLWAAIALLAAIVTAPAQTRRLGDRPVRLASRGTRGAVAAGTEAATEAGMRLYHQGGNAVDAGIATMLAASVVEFSHFGFGGEAPILIRTRGGRVHAIAGVGTMPRAATADFFRQRKMMPEDMTVEPEKNGMRAWVPVIGILPALTPGMVDAALVALRDFGSKTLGEAIQPAIDLADGWAIDEIRSNYIERTRKHLERWPTSRRVFLPGGKVPVPGDIFRQPDLARTLRSLVEVEKRARESGKDRAGAIDGVRDFFYRGEIARRIDAFSKNNGGLLRYEDMAAFRLQAEEPVSTTYKGYTVYKPGFWSQGPSLIQALNILEGVPLAKMGLNSADYIHTTVEALKLAYADRDTYYGDPKFNRIPAERLLSKEYAEERRKLIGPAASLEFRPGRAVADPPAHPSQVHMARVKIDEALMAKDTTCVDAIDRDGMAFSATPSGSWLPSVIAGDTGIPLTQRAQSFLLVPGHPNELGGGKRPRVTLSPTLVSRSDGTVLALSTPGGDNQDQSLLQVLLDVVEFGMNAQTAVEAARFQTRHLVSSFDNHAMHPGDLLLDERIPAEVLAELKRRQHRVETRSRYSSGAAPVLVRLLPGGVIEAGADPYGWRVSKAW
jgi:gamma-glutamyltranspeptidase / glutathione hydrolase